MLFRSTANQQTNGNTLLAWNVNTSNIGLDPASGDKFEVQRADNPNFNNPVTVGQVDYVSTTSSYTLVDKTSEENLNGTYYYRIRRTKTANEWGWSLSMSVSVPIVCQHLGIASAVAVLGENNFATITWKYDSGNIWTAGSNVILERYNMTNGGAREVITIPASNMVTQTYTEELVQMCNRFVYKLYVKPGVIKYPNQEAVTATGDDIVPIDIGNVLSVNASKGYFADRTELTWSTDGKPIDLFAIKSRIYESGHEFKQISQVNASGASTIYQFIDEKCNPGEIYEYQIIGFIQCANQTKSTDTLYTYGFRTPTGDIYGRITFESGQAVENVEVRLESSNTVVGKSLQLTSGQKAVVNSGSFLEDITSQLTLQAWISPNQLNGVQKIVSKPGMYEIGIENNYLYMSVSSGKLISNKNLTSYLASQSYIHVTRSEERRVG